MIKNLLFILLLIAFCMTQAKGQDRLMAGRLTDDTGNPLPGVSIFVKGTTKGTISDADGKYQILAPVGSTLVFQGVGFTTQEVIVPPAISSDGENEDEPKIIKHKIPEGEETLSPYFFVKSDSPETDRLPLKHTSAEVNIAGVIADVVIKQIYINEGENTLEAIYIFPGSTQAAVYGMQMRIGDRLLMAKIKEKVAARQEYEKAKEEGKTATLLEQKRPNVFQMNVANIQPGDSITVELRYTELLVPTDGVYEFVYPTVVGPRYSDTPKEDAEEDEKWVETPYLQEEEEPTYTFDLKHALMQG